MGFGWGFSGTITDWNEGHLARFFSKYKNVSIRLEPDMNINIPREFNGDINIISSNPKIRQLALTIDEIQINF